MSILLSNENFERLSSLDIETYLHMSPSVKERKARIDISLFLLGDLLLN